jgi:hypothetical protein
MSKAVAIEPNVDSLEGVLDIPLLPGTTLAQIQDS